MVDNQRAISQLPEQDAEELLAGTKLLLGSLSVLDVSKVHDDGGNIRVMAGVTQYRLHPSGFAPQAANRSSITIRPPLRSSASSAALRSVASSGCTSEVSGRCSNQPGSRARSPPR